MPERGPGDDKELQYCLLKYSFDVIRDVVDKHVYMTDLIGRAIGQFETRLAAVIAE